MTDAAGYRLDWGPSPARISFLGGGVPHKVTVLVIVSDLIAVVDLEAILDGAVVQSLTVGPRVNPRLIRNPDLRRTLSKLRSRDFAFNRLLPIAQIL